MTQEDKNLLLRYLCMALPYDVIVDYENHIYILNEIDPSCRNIDYITVLIQDVERLMCAKNVMIENIKPYLHSMSSMTENEMKEYNGEFEKDRQDILKVGKEFEEVYKNKKYESVWQHPVVPMYRHIIWLLKNHFDFMGLIPKDLAVEVTKSNNPYKN